MKDDDFKLLKGFALRRTDKRTNGQTFAIVESLWRLKNSQSTKTSYWSTRGQTITGLTILKHDDSSCKNMTD